MQDKIRIAIADDHKLIREGINMILSSVPQFLVVQQASNGRDLLDGLKTSKPDVILLDIEMPILSGPETLKAVKKNNPDLPVLILTMHKSETFILQMMELGANGYLIKDTDPKEVIEAIHKVIQSKFYFSEPVSMAMLKGISSPKPALKDSSPKSILTEREMEIMRLICKEYTTTEIGQALFLSPKTIEGYRKILMDKTEAKNMAGLVLYAVRHGIYSATD